MIAAKLNQFMHFAGAVRVDISVSLDWDSRPRFQSRDMHTRARRVWRHSATLRISRLTKARQRPLSAVEMLDGQHRDTQASQGVAALRHPNGKGSPMTQFELLADIAAPILGKFAERENIPPAAPLPISEWVAMALLQKSVRRDAPALALGAAATLLRLDPDKFWRRALCIAYEDIGLADLDTVTSALAAVQGKRFRAQHGGEWQVAAKLTLRLCQAPKCRAADDLLIASAYHPALDGLRRDIASEALSDHLRRIEQSGALLGRALAVWHATGSRRGHIYKDKQRPFGHPAAVFATLRSAGIEDDIVTIAERGFRRVREVLCANLCLLHPLLPNGSLPTEDDEFPAATMNRRGVPTFALDMFSHEGRNALGRFLGGRNDTARWIKHNVPAQRRIKLLGHALFRIESGLVKRRVRWPVGDSLRLLADSGFSGMPTDTTVELLQMLRSDLSALDKERADA